MIFVAESHKKETVAFLVMRSKLLSFLWLFLLMPHGRKKRMMTNLEKIIKYIKEDSEIAIPIKELFHESGRHLTKKEYGLVLIKHLVIELEEKFLNQAPTGEKK